MQTTINWCITLSWASMRQGARFCLQHSDECSLGMQLPASFFAYRKQQHRWTCGPVQLWRKAAVDIWGSSLPLFSKLDLIFCYFGIRKFATHWVSLGFFCTIVPLSVFTPEVGHRCTCHLLPAVISSVGFMSLLRRRLRFACYAVTAANAACPRRQSLH